MSQPKRTGIAYLTRWRPHQQWEGYLFLLPSILGVLVFTAFPVFFSFGISFTDWDLVKPPQFIGLSNFINLFRQDVLFGQVVGNMLFYVVAIVPLQTGISLILATALNRKMRGMGAFRVIYYVPVITTIVAAALIFQFMFDRDYGVINAPLWWLGDLLHMPVSPPDWLNSSQSAKFAVIILTLWKNIGFTTIMFIAGLQTVPRDLHEAAMIDGANGRQRFFNVTLPLISPTTFFVVVILVIGAFQLFSESFIMTRGGPASSTLTAVQYIYQSAFEYSSMGKAAAISWVLFAVIFVFTLIQTRLQNRWVYYEAGDGE